MRTVYRGLKRYGWPLSALLLGPWSGGLLFSLALDVTAGSSVGVALVRHYDVLRTVLVSLCSLYCGLAFMMWVVGKRPRMAAEAAPRLESSGFSSAQVLGWGLLGVLLIPLIAFLSTLQHQSYLGAALTRAFRMDPAMNAGFLWLVSLSTLIMTPIMVVWLVWMWRSWVTHTPVEAEAQSWEYEHE
ncbi:MAG: hypothetical protein AB7N91_23565 [Candidatus Tectimicrobiota bacterium]